MPRLSRATVALALVSAPAFALIASPGSALLRQSARPRLCARRCALANARHARQTWPAMTVRGLESSTHSRSARNRQPFARAGARARHLGSAVTEHARRQSARLVVLRVAFSQWLQRLRRTLSLLCVAAATVLALGGVGVPAADAVPPPVLSRVLGRGGEAKKKILMPGESIPDLHEFQPAKLPLEQWLSRDVVRQYMTDPTVDHGAYRLPGDKEFLSKRKLFDSQLGTPSLDEQMVLEQRYWEFRSRKAGLASALGDVAAGIKYAVIIGGTGFAVVWTVRTALRMAKEEEIELYGEELSVDATEIEPEEVTLPGLEDDDDYSAPAPVAPGDEPRQ